MMALGLTLFLLTERLVTTTNIYASVLDDHIPFIPATWFIYTFYCPYVILLASLATPLHFKQCLLAAFLAFNIAMCCFFMFPEQIVRPDLSLIHNHFLNARFLHMWWLDAPTHGFPSLHVTITCIFSRPILCRQFGWLVALISMLICISTLTVKQHTLLDVAGGVTLALIATSLAVKLLPALENQWAQYKSGISR